MATGKFVKSLLDMTESVRMKRARDLGFNTSDIYHHGTPADFNEFDLEKGGHNFGDFASTQGIFSATNEKLAERYGDIKKLLLRSENPKLIDVEKKIRDEYEYLVSRGEYSGNFDDFLNDFAEGNPYGFYEQGSLGSDLAEAKSQGHDAVILDFGALQDADFGNIGKVSVSFKPKNIRDVKAAFDPSKRESANLLAATIPAAVGIGSALKGQNISAQEFIEPKGKFPKDLLADYINNNPVSITEMMFAGEIQPSVKAPINRWAVDAANFARRYNQERKKRVHPMLDMILPGAELPAEYLDKLGYGDKVTIADRAKAILGLI